MKYKSQRVKPGSNMILGQWNASVDNYEEQDPTGIYVKLLDLLILKHF